MQKCCRKITCGPDQGSAFFVGQNLLITAFHVVLDSEETNAPILLHNRENTVKCKIKSVSTEFDICILETELKNSDSLPLLATQMRVAEKCNLAGYPYKGQSDFLNFSVLVPQLIFDERSDFYVTAKDFDKEFDYEGMSGGPVISSGRVTGIALRQIDNLISCISIYKIRTFLLEQGIVVEDEQLYHEVPKEFKDAIKGTTPNFKVYETIDEALLLEGNWLILQGTPGSGKTTLAASYNPSHKNMTVLGRYFLKVPNDPTPISVRTSSQFFLETLENLLSNTLTGLPLSKEELKFEERLKRLSNLFHELNVYFETKSQLAILIVDGIDEAHDISNFLAAIPTELGKHLKIILCCTSIVKLPQRISSQLSSSNIVNVVPLELIQCEYIIKTELQELNLSVNITQSLALKSEGHPLYLRYLVTYIKSNKPTDSVKLEEWIESMPVIAGDIFRYYDSIWNSIYTDPNKLWILIVLSNLRQPVDIDTLYEILPNQFRLTFTSNYPAVNFLLAHSDLIEIYHSSFKEYILVKTKVNISTANDLIIEYCNNNSEVELAINNIVYHLSKSSYPTSAIDRCNQSWADKCAINHVAPDLIINDIKISLSLALTTKDIAEVIRLLLLLQRIGFRYDSVFAENATFIAQTLISLKKYSAALKYLVRDNTLLVSNNDALFFLQQFYEKGATDEASILLEAIDQKYRKLIQEGFGSEEGLDLNVFSLKLNSLVLFMNEDFDLAAGQWLYFQRKIKELEERASASGDMSPANHISNIREHCAAWQIAYAIRQFNIYNDSVVVSNVTKLKPDTKLPTMLAEAAIIFDELNSYNGKIVPENKTFHKLIADLETVIDRTSYSKTPKDLFILTSALIYNSSNTAIVDPLANEYLKTKFEFNLRMNNGVDLNHSSVNDLIFRNICEGYIDLTDNYPTQPTDARHTHWEKSLVFLIQMTGFIEGKFLRLKSINSTNKLNELEKRLGDLIRNFNFTLDERSRWERSYYLPEQLIPKLLNRVFNIINECAQTILPNTINSFHSASICQFGLYTEGFRQSLFVMVTSCIRHGAEKKIFIPLIELWEDHVLQIQNRWERSQELLKITEVYGLVDETVRASTTFLEMLNTSMGPTWYKESQLTLINDALKLCPNDATIKKYVQQFAGILDYASGEMTFQRYVRHEKETFVKSLMSLTDLATAIEYFNFEVVPPPTVLICNAESYQVDSPRLGDGYALGARNITEQSAVLNLMAINTSPYVRWSIIQVFLINDDTFRYIHDFASLQAKCINELQTDKHFLAEAISQISEAVQTAEIQEDRNLYEYIGNLYKSLDDAGKEWLSSSLKIKIEWESFGETKSTELSKEKNSFDDFNFKYKSTKFEKSELLANGFNAFSKERTSIWYRNWSTSSNETRQTLKELLSSTEEALQYLKPYIEEYDDEYWCMASEILWFTRNLLTEEQKGKVLFSVAEHFQFIVRTDQQTMSKYSWLSHVETKHSSSSDRDSINFLIDLLNHPTEKIAEKASASLLNLSKYESLTVLSCLINELIKNQPRESTQQCALILVEISKNDLYSFIKFLNENKEVIYDLKNVKHFSIKKLLLDIGIEANKLDFKLLYNSIMETVPQNIVLTGEVALDEKFLEPIEDLIDVLNNENLLNRTVCDDLLNLVVNNCKPLSPSEFRKSDRYLLRSFYQEGQNGRYLALLKHCLNVAITPRITKSNYENIFRLLN